MVGFSLAAFFGDFKILDVVDEVEEDNEVDRGLEGVDPWERVVGAIAAFERRYESWLPRLSAGQPLILCSEDLIVDKLLGLAHEENMVPSRS